MIMKRNLMFMSLCALLCLASCESKKKHAEAETKFLVTSPIVMDTMTIREYVCQIRSIRHIELRALERGYLQEYFVDEGKFVKKGSPMFQIMPLLYQAELEKAQAEADFAQIEYLNTKSLADSNVVAPNELALAKANYDKAKAQLSLAQVHLGFTKIKAPFDGIMDRLEVRQGSLLDEGDLLSTISDISEMWVYFNVPEAEYLDYKSNLKGDSSMVVKLKMANNKMFEFSGEVSAIEADFNNETGNIAFRATFQNPNGLLRHGETGNVIVRAPLKQALLIPQKATFEILDKKYVFIVDEDHHVKSRVITIGTEMPDLYAITGGLKESDKILLEGLRLVRENDEIHYEFEDPKEVISHLHIHAE